MSSMIWRKSSYSGESGGACVELAWRKSSYSGQSGGQCVELALEAGAIRDSKSPDGPVLHLTPEALTAFIAFVK